ncbi:MAG: hydrolase / 5-amino-6-(5-phospho-D-ribitylamino)uracil phosphatase [Pseudomonadota bacterium]|nr:hydrolase / 5-amino-6-(5-phospho-D-ribitylamino)uracil phosphatase [Pseudomonadota bacterium]
MSGHSPKNQPALLTLDLDDTLWPCMPVIAAAERTSYDWLEKNLPRITLRYSMEDLRNRRKQLMLNQPALKNDLSEARRVHFRELADEFGYGHEWIEEGFRVFYTARQQVTFYDDVLPVLSQLASRYKLIALTNGNAHIHLTGLSGFFVAQFSAADVQAAKPHPAMFHRAMQFAGVSPEQTLHVGDHAIHDIEGARTAGVRSVWVNRNNDIWQHDDFVADYEVKNLYGLLELLL